MRIILVRFQAYIYFVHFPSAFPLLCLYAMVLKRKNLKFLLFFRKKKLYILCPFVLFCIKWSRINYKININLRHGKEQFETSFC
jgi:hypothetical protein